MNVILNFSITKLLNNLHMHPIITRLVFLICFIISGINFAASQVSENFRHSNPTVPVYKTLKDLYINTTIVQNNQPKIIIVAPKKYAFESNQIQATIKKFTGISIEIISDAADDLWPLKSNVILLGNRSSNELISSLYDRGYTFLDLKYPGKGGYVVRSLHNPLGNGKNVLFIGGSDAEGEKASTIEFIKLLKNTPMKSRMMTVGYLSQIKLGDGYSLPGNIDSAKIWEASENYRSTGYFGWNSISKNMALFYMTGKERFLREFLRLSFPDSAAIKELEVKDGERIEDKKHPLSGPYHYNAYMMIQMWDLIEESPLLNDEQRLKITNAFAGQLEHRLTEYGSIYWITKPPDYVFERHYDWAAFSLYALGRYFAKDYPDTVWTHCLYVSDLYFSRLKSTYWAHGNEDFLPWFGSNYDPTIDYLLYSGKRDQDMLDNLRRALNTQQIVSTGKQKDWGLSATSLSMLNKAAYILKDGRWLYYREHINLDTDVFRLGQSFWPDSSTLKPVTPLDLVGVWNIQWMPKEMWQARLTGFPQNQSFRWGSYRSELGKGGDYMLLKGYNGANRFPYHNFGLLELRLNGSTLLKGYHNQVYTTINGLSEPKVSMDAALLYQGVVGNFCAAIAEVPNIPFAKWKRSLILNKNHHFVLISDELSFKNNSANFQSETSWETRESAWLKEGHALKIQPFEASQSAYKLYPSEVMNIQKKDGIISMRWRGNVKQGQKRSFFYLLGKEDKLLSSLKLTDQAAVVCLPEPGVIVTGNLRNIHAELALMTENELFGHDLFSAGLDQPLLHSSAPIEVNWELNSGIIEIECKQPSTLSLALRSPVITTDGVFMKGTLEKGMFLLNLSAGKHRISNAFPRVNNLKRTLTELLNTAKQTRSKEDLLKRKSSPQLKQDVRVPDFSSVMKASVEAEPVKSIVIPSAKGDLLALSAGNNITLLASNGMIVRKLSVPGRVRVLRWWSEYKLLLVGCTDEKVIAFDELGQKKWEFVSEMDSAVYEAAKQYWMKSRYPGVYGLYSGYFDNGKSRAFVGSACTLEILDENGQLVKRLPVFWGNPSQFLMVDAADGTKQLLAARWMNDGPTMAVISSKNMRVEKYGYYRMPQGHTFINGWMSINRFYNFLADIEGNGKPEIISAFNGIWNRITIYTEDGKPIHNIQIGPGSAPPVNIKNTSEANIRMMDVGDLISNGRQLEIMAGLSTGEINVFDNKAQLLWSKHLPNPPTVLKLIKGFGSKPWLFVGTENGMLMALDAEGKVIRQEKISGKPIDVQVLQTDEGPMVIIITEKGEVRGYRL
jgi:hypothetical protein